METNNLAILQRIVEEGFGARNFQVIDELMSDSCAENQFGMKGGKDGIKKSIQSLHQGFPDIKYHFQKFSENQNTIWVHYKVSGTHLGDFMGIPPTGGKFTIDLMDVARVENGQVVEHWGIPDRFALLSQLGLLNKNGNRP